MSKRILVVGANSFLAQALIVKLKSSDNEIVGVFNRNKDKLVSEVPYLSIDESRNLKDVFDLVFIVSAYIPRDIRSHTKLLFEINVNLVNELLAQFPSARFVFCSSVSVYGYQPSPLSEDSNLSPLTEYAVSKLWGEVLLKNHHSYAIVRISSIYGEGMSHTTFIPKIIKSAIAENKLVLKGDGSRRQNYIHVNDVADVLIKASLLNENGIYLATDDREYTNYEVAKIVQEITNCNITFEGVDNTPDSFYDNKKTKNVLGYHSIIDFQKGIKEVVKWISKEY